MDHRALTLQNAGALSQARRLLHANNLRAGQCYYRIAFIDEVAELEKQEPIDFDEDLNMREASTTETKTIIASHGDGAGDSSEKGQTAKEAKQNVVGVFLLQGRGTNI
jgi:hypothetical protein